MPSLNYISQRKNVGSMIVFKRNSYEDFGKMKWLFSFNFLSCLKES